MASGQTEHYGLNQWQAGNQVLREDFNRDNQKVDGALAGLAGQVAVKADQTAVDGLAASVAAELAKKYGTDNPVLVEGSYTGTYAGSGSPTAATVTLGFRPSFVAVFSLSENLGRYDYLALLGTPAAHLVHCVDSSDGVYSDYLTFSNTGFTVDAVLNSTCGFNLNGTVYHYFAFR